MERFETEKYFSENNSECHNNNNNNKIEKVDKNNFRVLFLIDYNTSGESVLSFVYLTKVKLLFGYSSLRNNTNEIILKVNQSVLISGQWIWSMESPSDNINNNNNNKINKERNVGLLMIVLEKGTQSFSINSNLE